MNENRWFPAVGIAVKVQPYFSVSHFDGFMWAADKEDARKKMLEISHKKMPFEDDFTGHYAVILDYPEFTITKI